jgi:hypothetical protein
MERIDRMAGQGGPMTVQTIAAKAGALLGEGVARMLIAKHALERNVTRTRSHQSIASTPPHRQGAISGNSRTRIYHNASDAHLPDEERRVYFASVEEAETPGYRAAGKTTTAYPAGYGSHVVIGIPCVSTSIPRVSIMDRKAAQAVVFEFERQIQP